MKSGPSTPLAFAELVLDSNGERQDPKKAISKGLGSKPRLQLKDLKRIRRSLTMDNPNLLPPPLPLPNTSPRTDELEGPFTGAEEELPAVQFKEPESLTSSSGLIGAPPLFSAKEALYPPYLAWRLGAYMSLREAKAASRLPAVMSKPKVGFDRSEPGVQSASRVASLSAAERQTMVYLRPNPFEVAADLSPLSPSSSAAQPPAPASPPADTDVDSLSFDAAFESGNLLQALRVYDRAYSLSPLPAHVQFAHLATPAPAPVDPMHGSPGRSPAKGSETGYGPRGLGLPAVVLPSAVHQEYDLLCRPDSYTTGNIQWYFFSVQVPDDAPLGLRVRFNIVNMMKSSSLYSFGMRPCVFSTQTLHKEGIGWAHMGEDVCYYKNTRTYTLPNMRSKATPRHYFTLSWVHTFRHPGDRVFFAHCYPYTYTDMRRDLLHLVEDSRTRPFCRTRTLGHSIAGNAVPLLTITSHTHDPAVLQQRPAIVITARAHGGETNSSWVLKGVMEFLTSPCKEAVVLRDHFVFKLVPMINPDGVINGNYRTSLPGCDLNRRYAGPSESLHPTVSAVKRLLRATKEHRGVLLYIDLHGHSRKKNCFLYGCDAALAASGIGGAGQPSGGGTQDESKKGEDSVLPTTTDDRVFARVIPRLLFNMCKRPAAVTEPPKEGRSEGATATKPARSPQQTRASKASSPQQQQQQQLHQQQQQRRQPQEQQACSTDASGASVPSRPQPDVWSGGYFSYRDCSFAVQKSKASTGRVVAWSELGIPNSFTLEASFCGAGHNGEQRLLKRLSRNADAELRAFMRQQSNTTGQADETEDDTAGDQSSDSDDERQERRRPLKRPIPAVHQTCVSPSVSPGQSTAEASALPCLSADDMEVLHSFAEFGHFDRQDFMRVGHRLCEAIVDYANLPKAALQRSAYRYRAGHITGEHLLKPDPKPSADSDSDADSFGWDDKDEGFQQEVKARSSVPVVTPDEWQAFLTPGVLDAQVAAKLAPSWARARAEVEVRDILKRREEGVTGEEPGEEEESDSGGSDSEPSVAELPASWLKKSRAWKSMTTRLSGRRSSSLSSSQEAERKRTRKTGKKKAKADKGLKAGSGEVIASPSTTAPASVSSQPSSDKPSTSVRQRQAFMEPTLARVSALRAVLRSSKSDGNVGEAGHEPRTTLGRGGVRTDQTHFLLKLDHRTAADKTAGLLGARGLIQVQSPMSSGTRQLVQDDLTDWRMAPSPQSSVGSRTSGASRGVSSQGECGPPGSRRQPSSTPSQIRRPLLRQSSEQRPPLNRQMFSSGTRLEQGDDFGQPSEGSGSAPLLPSSTFPALGKGNSRCTIGYSP